MPITSSTYSLGVEQIDGRRWCVERHTDHQGIERVVEYLSAVGVDNAAVLAARAVSIADRLKQAELNYAVFEAPWDYTLQWATNNDLAAWVREEYKISSKERLARIAARILEWITNGRFTDTQVRNAFNLSASQWTTLKGKMQTLVNNYIAVEAAVGE